MKMDKKLKFKTVEKCMTPSGCWDNGLYEISEKTIIEIPEKKMKEAVIERNIELKGVRKVCNRITIDGVGYLVVEVKENE